MTSKKSGHQASRTTDFRKVRMTEPRTHRTIHTGGQSYSTPKSFLFPGYVTTASDSHSVDNAALVFPPAMVSDWYESTMSFDVRFALLPASEGKSHQYGGVIFGGQETHHTEPKVNNRFHIDSAYEAYVRVDSNGNLFCMGERVGEHLKPLVWYHVAVSMSSSHDYCIYVNGQLVGTEKNGGYYGINPFIKFMQIGTGFYKGQRLGFNGIVDEFRVWNGTLSDTHVQLLQRGDEKALLADLKKTEVRRYTCKSMYEATFEAECLWSLQDEVRPRVYGDVQLVHCTPTDGDGRLEVYKRGRIHQIIRSALEWIPLVGELFSTFDRVKMPVPERDLRYEDLWRFRPKRNVMGMARLR